MKTNPFYDTWMFLLGQTNDHKGSGVGWLLTILFVVLLLSSFWIARKNWVDNPAQRTKEHLATWFMRLMIGAMWFQASLWKLPLPVSGGLNYWTRQMIPNAAFDVHRYLVENVIVPGLPYLNPFVYLTELMLAVSFMLGILVRPVAVIGILFTLQLWFGLYRHPHEWPWLYVFLMFTMAFFILHNAGKSLGLDLILERKAKGDGRLAKFYRRFA